MDIQSSLRLELQIPAQRLVSQYVTNNENIEKQVKKGIESALDNLCKDDNLAALINKEVYRTLRESFSRWEISRTIRDTLEEKLHNYLLDKAQELTKMDRSDLQAIIRFAHKNNMMHRSFLLVYKWYMITNALC